MLIVFFGVGTALAQAAGPPPDQGKPPKTDNRNNTGDATKFSDAVANSVLSELRDGLEGHSQRLMLSAFDSDRMSGYLIFKDQIQAFFETYETFRVHYRIAQTTTEDSRGIVLVDFELEQTARGENAPPQRRSSQIRFELERGTKGWKIVDFEPRSFFS